MSDDGSIIDGILIGTRPSLAFENSDAHFHRNRYSLLWYSSKCQGYLVQLISRQQGLFTSFKLNMVLTNG